MTKVCPICGTEFEPRHHNQKYCSPECVKKVAREKDRLYREANLEKCRACGREYYRENREERIAYQREYQRSHADQIRVYKREYMRRWRNDRKDRREMEKETHGCGFTGLCSDCPFEMCTE